jgi:hypothetical protein
MATEQPTPPLRCLGGLPPPPDVVADLGALASLPLPARRQIYQVLGLCLVEPVPEAVDVEIDRFCRALSLDAAVLSRVLKASRFLLRQAAVIDLAAADFAADLVTLGDTGALHEALVPGYEAAKRVVRSEIARGALDDHGKVVERVAWRVDHVTASHRGQGLDVPVVVLTLGYREGQRQDRVTLQLLPDALLDLQAMCQRLL